MCHNVALISMTHVLVVKFVFKVVKIAAHMLSVMVRPHYSDKILSIVTYLLACYVVLTCIYQKCYLHENA